tara:strand:- start:284 stop:490 length:207 start_codon:yes stop_codon:yes gene_type:complete
MIRSILKIALIITLIGFLSISPKSRNLLGISMKYFSQFLLWTTNEENQDKWIMDAPNWLKRGDFSPSY